MADGSQPFSLTALAPGIKRDGTLLEGNACVEGRWTRWQRKLPRKMGGVNRVIQESTGPVRGMDLATTDGVVTIHYGFTAGLERIQLSENGSLATGVVDRTPVSYSSYPDVLWQFTEMYDTATGVASLIAHPGRNLTYIDNTNTTSAFIGTLNSTSNLVPVSGIAVAGGVTVLHPFAFFYDDNGLVTWSEANKPTSFSSGLGAGTARITQDKIVYGAQVRGGPTNAPTGLFWSLSTLIRASFAGTATTTFKFDTLSDQISILSSQCVVEYDGNFYWIGTDRFMRYDGSVKEVPNEQNINWFFDNLNWNYRQKVFVHKRPRWGEIWWCFPYGSATECTHAVILNVREGCWYDTELLSEGRSAGTFGKNFRYPVAFGVDADADDKYALWVEEIGTDQVEGAQSLAIESYYETGEFSYIVGHQGVVADRQIRLNRIEPDFVQIGDMTVTVKGRQWVRPDPPSDQGDVTFTFDPDTERTDMLEQRAYLRLRFTSNVAGGTFQAGNVLLHFSPGDGNR